MFDPRTFYALVLLLIIGGVAAYTRDPDWNLPTGPKAAQVTAPGSGSGLTNTRRAVRRTMADGPNRAASVEVSKPSSTNATDLLGDPADPSGANDASGGRSAVMPAGPEAGRTHAGMVKTGNATTSPKPKATKKPATVYTVGVSGDASRRKAGLARLLTGRAARSSRPSQMPAARRKRYLAANAEPAGRSTTRRAQHVSSPYGRRMRLARRHAPVHDWYRGGGHAIVAARSNDPDYSAHSAYPGYSGACGAEPHWAMTAFGYQQTWVRMCR